MNFSSSGFLKMVLVILNLVFQNTYIFWKLASPMVQKLVHSTTYWTNGVPDCRWLTHRWGVVTLNNIAHAGLSRFDDMFILKLKYLENVIAAKQMSTQKSRFIISMALTSGTEIPDAVSVGAYCNVSSSSLEKKYNDSKWWKVWWCKKQLPDVLLDTPTLGDQILNSVLQAKSSSVAHCSDWDSRLNMI